MARIEGVDLPRDKRALIGLTYIYGIGRSRSEEILAATKIDHNTKIKDLTEAEVQSIREFISTNFRVEGDLRREIQMNIKRLKDIGTYRGLRHKNSLPVRGQRTRTNGRTQRGSRKTVAGRGRRKGAMKK